MHTYIFFHNLAFDMLRLYLETDLRIASNYSQNHDGSESGHHLG